MIKRIRIMAEYGPLCLWWDGPDRVGPIEPNTLPLAQSTIEQLEKWAQTYHARLNLADPKSSKFFTKEEFLEFDREGLRLLERLVEELPPDYEVVYFSERLGKRIRNPSELLS